MVVLLPWWHPDFYIVLCCKTQKSPKCIGIWGLSLLGLKLAWAVWLESPVPHGSLFKKWNDSLCCVVTLGLRSLGVICAFFTDNGGFVICTWSQWDLQGALVIGPVYLIWNMVAWPAKYKKPQLRFLELLWVVLCTCQWFPDSREKNVSAVVLRGKTVGTQACLSSLLAG